MSDTKDLTDLDLAPYKRTLANLYQAKWLGTSRDLRAAHRGIDRLRRRLDARDERIAELEEKIEDKDCTIERLHETIEILKQALDHAQKDKAVF
jgi:chromosome segregation ATPase